MSAWVELGADLLWRGHDHTQNWPGLETEGGSWENGVDWEVGGGNYRMDIILSGGVLNLDL